MIITIGNVRVEVSREPRDLRTNLGEIRRAYEGLLVDRIAKDARLRYEMEVSEYLPVMG